MRDDDDTPQRKRRGPKETVTVYLSDSDTGEVVEQEAPGKFEVCPTCDGRGAQALHGIAITADEWNGPDWDDESREMYLSGGYDNPCPTCNGLRVVCVLDRERATPEQIKAYEQQLEDDAEARNEQMWERCMLGERD